MPPALSVLSAVDRAFLDALGRTAVDMIRAFYAAGPAFPVPQTWLLPVMVGGVFLVVAGTAFATAGKGRFWAVLGLAAAAGLAAWVFTGGTPQTLEFLSILLLILAFLGGVTFVFGLLRTVWVPALLLLCIVLAASGLADASLLGRGLGVLASFLGALSLFRKAEEFSPGKTGSRWNRRVAAGWVACLLAASLMDGAGLGALSGRFKLAGIVVGVATVIVYPSLLRRGGLKVGLAKSR